MTGFNKGEQNMENRKKKQFTSLFLSFVLLMNPGIPVWAAQSDPASAPPAATAEAETSVSESAPDTASTAPVVSIAGESETASSAPDGTESASAASSAVQDLGSVTSVPPSSDGSLHFAGSGALPAGPSSTETEPASGAETASNAESAESAVTAAKDWKDVMKAAGYKLSGTDAGRDFRSMRLLVAADRKQIADPEHILAEADGMCLLQYDSVEDAKLAYAYYAGLAAAGAIAFADVDIPVQTAAGEAENPTGSDTMTKSANPLTELNETGTASVPEGNTIALIDTGVPAEYSNVVGSVSMIGDDATDTNGHGTKMLKAILTQDPDAKVLSIKALDSDGVGSISSVYAAMRYAIDSGVKVINLSLYAYSKAENASLQDIVNEAASKGIVVVGAAGNKGRNVKYFTPGNIASAIIVGAADAKGQRLASSNYGDTVDCNVTADSTSYAAALMSGYIAKHMAADGTIDYQVNRNGLIWSTDYVPVESQTVSSEASSEVEGVAEEEGEVVTDLPDEDGYFRIATAADILKVSLAWNKALCQSPTSWRYKSSVPVMTGYRRATITVRDEDGGQDTSRESNAYCLQPRLDAPDNGSFTQGTGNRQFTILDDDGSKRDQNIAKCMFYGFGGPLWGKDVYGTDGKIHNLKTTMQKLGATTDSECFTATHFLISSFYEQNWNERTDGRAPQFLNAKGVAAINSLRNEVLLHQWVSAEFIVNGKDVTDSSVQGTASGHETVTPWILYRAYVGNEASLRVPAGLTLEYQDGKTVKSGNTATIAGNASFRFKSTSTKAIQAALQFTCKYGADYTVVKLRQDGRQDMAIAGMTTHRLNLKVNMQPMKTTISIQKSSANSQISSTGSYSLAGAKYGVYGSKADAEAGRNPMETLTTDGSGHAVSGSNYTIDQTYFVREIASPAGFGLDKTVYTVKASSNASANVVKSAEPPKTVCVAVKKVSDNSSITDDNPLYDLSGAEFTVYTDKACTQPLGKLTAGTQAKDADGHMAAQTNTLGGLTIGRTYYVKETKAPKSYSLNDTVFSVTPSKDNTEQNPAIVLVKDSAFRKYPFSVTKKNKDGGSPQSNQTRDTTGTTFTVKYYNHDFDTLDEAAQYQPVYTWTLTVEKTDGNVKEAFFHPAQKGGYFQDEDGNFVFPLGTLTFEEDKPAFGYTKDGATLTDSNKTSSSLPTVFQIKGGKEGAELLHNGKAVSDEFTVDDPELTIRTVALDQMTGTAYTGSTSARTLVDHVACGNLSKGASYVLVGRLLDKADGSVIATGTSAKAFTGEGIGKTTNADVLFTGVETAKYQGHDLLVEEYLLPADGNIDRNGKVSTDISKAISSHTADSMSDEEKSRQTIHVPKIGTVAASAETGDKVLPAGKKTVVNDTVTYQNLEPNRTYTLHGVLMDKATGKALTVGGREVAATADFVPKTFSGTTSLTFTFDTTGLDGKTLVAFETVTTMGADGKTIDTIAQHRDLTDENQTVQIPRVTTEAMDAADDGKANTHHADAPDSDDENRTMTIVDKISFSNLKVGNYTDADGRTQTYAYQVNGFVLDRQTGKTIQSAVTAFKAGSGCTVPDAKPDKDGRYTFIPSSPDGYVVMTFTFSSEDLSGQGAVIGEHLYHQVEVAKHHDLTSKDQTVYIPRVYTEAIVEDTGDHTTGSHDDTIIIDTVNYTGLEKGSTYYIRGELHDRATGEKLESCQMVDDENKNIDYVAIKAETDEQASSGTVKIRFRVDGKDMADHTYVAFERLYLESRTGLDGKAQTLPEKVVGHHEDLTDHPQSVYVPKILTTAEDAKTTDNHTFAEKDATVIDRVDFTNLVPGYTYTVKGSLTNRTDGSSIPSDMIDENGNILTDGYSFRIPKNGEENQDSHLVITAHNKEAGKDGGVTGYVTITLRFDAKAVEGTTAVVFEDLLHNGKEVATHHDLTAKPQTVYIPKLRTHATDDATGDHVAYAQEKTYITDTVTYEGLEPGRTYRLYGTLMKKVTTEDGKVTGEDAGAQMVKGSGAHLTSDSTASEASALSASESAAASAADSTTSITSSASSTASAASSAASTTDGEADEPIEYVEFVPTAANGSVQIHFLLNTSGMKHTGLVAYETLMLVTDQHMIPEDKDKTDSSMSDPTDSGNTTPTAREELVGEHKDLTDEDQTVAIPEIRTHAVAQDTKTHETQASAETVVLDTVTWEGLLPGRRYEMTGVLVSKDDGKALLNADGNPYTLTEPFTAEQASGSITLAIPADTSALEGKRVVVFETCSLVTGNRDGKEESGSRVVATHADVNDEDQTVDIVNLRTHASSKSTGTQEADAVKDTVVVDRVTYTGLRTDREYTVKGTLYDKAAGKPLTVDGRNVTDEKSFTPDKPDGEVELTFTFDASALNGKTVVAFEDLYQENVRIATHSDLKDQDQSVNIVRIRTHLAEKSSGSQTVTNGTNVTLTDRVTYEGLTPNKTYTLKGRIMDKSTGQVTGVEMTQPFTPKNASGEVNLDFTLDTSKYSGKSLVAFEQLYDADNVLIAKHEDLNDADQTVNVPNPPSNPPGTMNPPKTGDTAKPVLFAVISAAALAVLLLLLKKQKKARK